MIEHSPKILVHRAVIESLTVEAMVLADELETFLADGGGGMMGGAVSAELARAGVAVSTQLTLLVDWLVWRDGAGHVPRPVDSIDAVEGDLASRPMPPQARALFAAAQSVFERAATLDNAPRAAVEGLSPARVLQERLARSLRS